MSEFFDQFAAFHERGLAVGKMNLHNDTISFTFKGKQWEFPLARAYRISNYNGYFLTAPIDKVKELAGG